MTLTSIAETDEFESYLTDTCDVLRKATSGTDSASGRPAPAAIPWPVNEAGVACRLDTKGGREIMIGKEIVVADFTLFLLPDADILEDDRITNVIRDGSVIMSGTASVKLAQVPGGTNHHKEVFLTLTRT